MRHTLPFGLSLVAASLAVTLASSPLYAAEPIDDEPINVVASFSVLADMVEQVGGEHVAVTALVGPDSDPHMFSPSPTEARAVAKADLVVFNGLNYEGWMERLITASDYDGALVTATDGISPLTFQGHDHGDHEAHAHGQEHDHSGHDHAQGSPDPTPGRIYAMRPPMSPTSAMV